MGKIDRELALEMMRARESDSKIAERFGTTRQAANLLRRSFVKAGTLAGSPASNSGVGQDASSIAVLPKSTGNVTTAETGTVAASSYPTFRQLTDWIVQLINNTAEADRWRQEHGVALAKVEELRAEVTRLQEELHGVGVQLTSATENARRYEAAIRRLGLPPIGGVQQPAPHFVGEEAQREDANR
jgi:hypothetical protein